MEPQKKAAYMQDALTAAVEIEESPTMQTNNEAPLALSTLTDATHLVVANMASRHIESSQPSQDSATEPPRPNCTPSGGYSVSENDGSLAKPLNNETTEKSSDPSGKLKSTTTETESDEKCRQDAEPEAAPPAPPKTNNLSSPAYTRSKRKRLEAEAAKATSTVDLQKRSRMMDVLQGDATTKTQTTPGIHRSSSNNKAKHHSQTSAIHPANKEMPGVTDPSEQKDSRQQQEERNPQIQTDSERNTPSYSPEITTHEKSVGPTQLAYYTEAYVELANRIVFTMDPSTQRVLQDLDLPGHAISGLGFLKAKQLRRPTIIEKWNPYEISMFQASLAHHGKRFEFVQKEIGTKTVQEIVDFYYVWKKTSHYQEWKKEYLPPHLDTDSDDEK
ncbi:hypothetical protein ACA910_010836 [Epithemia clementina (nom. ined.)]